MIETLSLDAWERFDRRAPAPTFFARPAFARAYCESTPGCKPWPMRVGVAGRSYLLPAIRRYGRSGFTELNAFPMGGYGCVLDEQGDPASAAAASAVLATVARCVDHVRFVAWPLGPAPVLPATTHAHTTAVVDCAAGLESVMSGMRGVTRRMAGQAQRRGIVCEIAEPTAEHIDAYYAILSEASHGWGLERPTISRALLGGVFQHGGRDAELWFARLDGEPVAGGVVLFGRDELFFWTAAMRRAYSTFRPSNALNVRLLARACERNVRWYNLGASEGLAGVERFKHDLGAHDVGYASLATSRPVYTLYTRLRTALNTMVSP